MTPVDAPSSAIHAPGVYLPEDQTLDKVIDRNELLKRLRLQLEYYFRRENLSTDAYLLSQMDSDTYVPIVTIAKFNQVFILNL